MQYRVKTVSRFFFSWTVDSPERQWMATWQCEPVRILNRMSQASSGSRCAKHIVSARSARQRPGLQGAAGSFSSRRNPAKQGPALVAGLSIFYSISFIHARARHTIGQFFCVPGGPFLAPINLLNPLIINRMRMMGACWEFGGSNLGKIAMWLCLKNGSIQLSKSASFTSVKLISRFFKALPKIL